MIDCLPEGICSWNFRLEGDGYHGRSVIDWCGETGSIEVGGVNHPIQKNGWLSGEWDLSQNHQPIATAKKRTFFREFKIESGEQIYHLQAESLGRTMRFSAQNGAAVLIKPIHPFTRRAVIEGEMDDFRIVCFAFWLTSITWRRAANSSAASS